LQVNKATGKVIPEPFIQQGCIGGLESDSDPKAKYV
jgi:hypothetical protein